MAAAFTGDAEISWPRPRGRSGCVITAAISMFDCARRWMKVGTAKCGVPQKRMRMGSLRGIGVDDWQLRSFATLRMTLVGGSASSPLALLLELFDFAPDQVALQHAEMLDEENAVEVVDFMAEGAGEEVFATDFKKFALGVLRLDSDKLRAQDVATEAGNRKATFFFALFTFGMDDFRVGQNDFRFGIFPAGYVDHGDAQIKTDLRRSQADALRGVHGGEHIFGKLLQVGVEVFYRCGGFLEDEVAVLDDGVDFARRGHGLRRDGWRGFRIRRFVGHRHRNSAASRR